MSNKYPYSYILDLSYLGFRYHGWQVQPDVKTVQYMLDRTLKHIFNHDQFKTLGSSRTDTMVSACSFKCQLFSSQELNPIQLEQDLKKNLPQDIGINHIKRAPERFQIINPESVKEYHYYFASGVKAHPYSAPFIYTTLSKLNIEDMEAAAKGFIGTHNFKQYCYRAENKEEFHKTIFESKIIPNNILTASFFPDPNYAFIVKGSGFHRHQIRIMMGMLIEIGEGKKRISDLENSLKYPSEKPESFIAPASGLHLIKNSIPE